MPDVVGLDKAPEVSPPVAIGGGAYNRVVELLNELRTIIGPGAHHGPGGAWFDAAMGLAGADEFNAVVTDRGPGGEPDFGGDDPRYWLVGANIDPAIPLGTTYPDDAPVVFSEKPASDTRRRWVAATNLSEVAGASHSLPVGTPVRARRIPDGSMRWVFNSGGSVPIGEFEQMVLQVVAMNTIGYDFVRLHAPIS